ncbi:MAG: methionyl-tRNA formyltransferase [Pseudomonadota bacterium]
MRLVFMGTPWFAVPALRALIEAGHELAGVWAAPPRPAGRGQRLRPSPVDEFAHAGGLAVATPASLKGEAAASALAALKPEVAVVVAYGLILPKAVLAVPRHGCLNIHASLLPRWRGAAPIQHAILAGDTETGITIMEMDEGLDTGAILLQEKIPIPGDATARSLSEALAAMGARLIVEALRRLAAGDLTPRPQAQDGVTHAAKLARDDGRLDWRQPAAALARRVRALDPWPGAWFEFGADRIKVLAAEIAAASAGAPGTALDDSLTIACGAGALRLLEVQRPGRAPMAAEDFLRGHPIPAGARLMR